MGRPQCTLPTQREVEVLRLIAQGQTNQEIADSLVIQKQTVVNHVRCMMVRLGLFRRVQLATYALKTGIITLDEIE